MVERNKRNTLEQFITCSRPFERNERNTPLWGVTVVRGVGLLKMFYLLPVSNALGVETTPSGCVRFW